MNYSSEPAAARHFTDTLDEMAASLDHIAAVADLLRLARTNEDLELLRVETVARAGALIDAEAMHVQRLVRELPAHLRSKES